MSAHALGRRARHVGLGLLLDAIIGEPPPELHPLVAFGRVMHTLEGRLYRDTRRAGMCYAAVGAAIGTIAGSLGGSTTVATTVAVGGRALRDAAREVHLALRADHLEHARGGLRALVGRDTTDLDRDEIARAVVESVAENTVDAVIAPASWALSLGSAGALAYRSINTMDAMVGYRNLRYERFGWASARLDDAANWLPARLTALLVVAVRPRSLRAVAVAVRTQAGGHPSPNAGVVEAAFAAALGVRLGGPNRYGDRLEVRAPLGSGRRPTADDIEAAVRLNRDVTVAMALVIIAIGSACGRRRAR